MIKVYFPQGCYGTYLAKCIYNYTDLRTEPFEKFTFDVSGSSHNFWSKKRQLYSKITYGHFDSPECNVNAEHVVVVYANPNHLLDYYNNQFCKVQYADLINWIGLQLSAEEAQLKLSTKWHYHGGLDEHVPRWIMREWCSFWISDLLQTIYDPANYSSFNSTVNLDAQNIFDNFVNTFQNVVSKLKLSIMIDVDIIHSQHLEFLSLQKYHASQFRCHQYLNNLLADRDGEIVVNTIFDEAYLQHLLRQNHLEIQCDGLNQFPSTIQQLKAIIYETSNHTNT